MELSLAKLETVCDDPWLIISNGRYLDEINLDLLEPLLKDETVDIIGVSFDTHLRGFREKLRLDRERKTIGFQRYYDDSCVPVPLSDNWPHRVFVRRSLVKSWDTLPLSYRALLKICRDLQAEVKEYRIGGNPVDLTQGSQVLRLFKDKQDAICMGEHETVKNSYCTCVHASNGKLSPMCRCYGHAWIGREVKIDPSVTLIGPVIIGDRVSIGKQAVIDTSIVGPDSRIESHSYISNTIMLADQKPIKADGLFDLEQRKRSDNTHRFKKWPVNSYIRCLKRILDIIFAVNVLLLFLPVIPVIALAIKINSPGPIFYRARRQGLHGKEFNCLKFRTMKVGADQLQDKLRNINEVDGPQFKMTDDPRISAVGRFLRETYLDEIPQFFNVLMGQMSVVGPRPSPKNENTHCPRWRDARLSVRPGVTGLWQLLRTREPSKDFQEWIHYDVEYVRRVSLKLDIEICCKTGLLMLKKFIQQF
jgi:lipopolysaccharide/colanic/teichoic acid biosynthesis glycosyltransferase